MATPGRGARDRQCPGPSGLAKRPAGQGLTAPSARRATAGGQDRSPPALDRGQATATTSGCLRSPLTARACLALARRSVAVFDLRLPGPIEQRRRSLVKSGFPSLLAFVAH